MNEDQFDFHSYCIRKVTLRAYVDLLRLVDALKEHPFYFKIAKLAIEIYLKLLDEPLKDDDSNSIKDKTTGEIMVNGKKSKKDKHRLKDENKENEQKNAKGKDKLNSNNVYSSLHSEPLISKELERPSNALQEAERFLKPLLLFASNRIDTHLLAFEIYNLKNKPLLMKIKSF